MLRQVISKLDGSRNPNEWLLRLHLETFVPFAIEEFLAGKRPLVMIRPDLATFIATNGDAILYRTPGRSARAVSALVEALATLAFCPGGVTFLGLHFEVQPERIKQCLPDFAFPGTEKRAARKRVAKNSPSAPALSPTRNQASFERLFREGGRYG